MFEAYITNTALYPLMGIEVGTTVHFPMTTQELQAALAKIGIDGKRYSEVFFTSFDSDVLGLYDHLYECENIDGPEHIICKLGKEHFAVPFPVYPDFGKGGLQLLCRHGEMYRCPYLDPH